MGITNPELRAHHLPAINRFRDASAEPFASYDGNVG
jgi:hypothetical protein